MQTSITLRARAEAAPPRELVTFDIESVRVASERTFAARIEQHLHYRLLSSRVGPSDSREVRRRLMAQSLQLTDTMAPDAYQVAREAQRILGVRGEIQLFQRSGAENASIHMASEPILMEIHGSLLSVLDSRSLLGVFGHELGHYVAHGPDSPLRGPLALTSLLGAVELERPFEQDLSKLSMLAELTADRVGLLACQDLHAMLRLEMVTLTGLSSGALTWDTEAYLAQSRDLIESALKDGTGFYGRTHPEHHLRAYALWLFSETQTYRDLSGEGPASRDLREVDELIAQFFQAGSSAQGELILDYSRLGEPPHELHECGLAAAVILAHADGEVADDEVAAIEAVFAALVPDWRTYLEYDIALERFYEAAPVLVAGGRDLLRTLFQILVHVMGADGNVDVREVETILAIGRALGVEADYRLWLASTLTALRVDVPVTTAAVIDLPLPARKDDVASAFEAFLAGVVRRGESAITMRRLLKLLGIDRRTDDVADRIARALQTRGIEASVDLRTFPLDQRIDLVAPATYRDADPRPSLAGQSSRDGLTSGLRRMRDQLVSGDGRSPSVRLRRAQRGRAFDLVELERVSVGLAERVLTHIREGKPASLVDAGDAGRYAAAGAAAAELLALVREHESRVEETGARDLYVGNPFLTGIIEGYAVRAPLVLYPVELERDGAGARGYRLRRRVDGAPRANQSLLRLIFNKKDYTFSEEFAAELDELAADPAFGAETIRQRLADVGLAMVANAGALVAFKDRDADLTGRTNFLQLEPCAVLGIFPQSNSDILQDYDGLLLQLEDQRTDVRTLLAAGAVMLPEGLVGPIPSAILAVDTPAERSPAPVIVADPSQRNVIAECRKHGATVVDGPPGTGKSQVIVNLVAEALSRGERVAVVCEKRAALDVVAQRLESLGLRHALAVVHDVQEDRKALYEQIAERLDNVDARPFDSVEAEHVRTEHADVGVELDARAEALRWRPDGLELTVGELLTLASGLDSSPVTAPEELAGLSQSGLRDLLDIVVALHPLRDVWSTASEWRAPAGTLVRPSLAHTDPRALRDFEIELDTALDAARRYEALTRQSPVDPETVESARTALGSARSSRAARAESSDRDLFSAVLASTSHKPDALRAAGEPRAAWIEARDAIVRLDRYVEITASDQLIRSLSVLRGWVGRWFRFFVVGWWMARFAFRRELAQAWPERSGDALTKVLFDDVADRIAASRAWTKVGAALDVLSLKHLLPGTAPELESFVGRLARLAPALREVTTARASLERAAAWLPTDQSLEGWDRAVDERLRLLESRDVLLAATPAVTAAIPWIERLPQSDVLERLLSSFRRDAERLRQADSLLDRAVRLIPSAPALMDALLHALPDASTPTWRAALTKTWAEAWLARLERTHAPLAHFGSHFDDRDVETFAARYGELETELRELETERIIALLDDAELLRTRSAEKHQRRSAAQKLREELLKETRKKRRVMALRSFVRQYAPQGLLDVVPVWLLSPETMAILFPRQPLFDLVVFDEASQCTVESGFPVLLRAKRVVIAGDEQQMPPSSYFTLRTGDEDDDLDTLEPAASSDDDKRAMKDMLSAESLLTLARTRVRHFGLEWHYRCRDEALIAFSNHAMYHGNLLTIPSTAGSAAPSVLHWIAVSDGVYNGGENRPEAARVVALVHDLLRRERPPSIGVVTFNLKQRRAVLDAVDQRCASDPDFGERWGRAMSNDTLDERPFVKNLEQVQGDERDVIIFSLGHAPQQRRKRDGSSGDSYVPARFGPLGQRGGERRLNVAISRAKAECFVVASFEPSQLEVTSSRNEGPKLFKQFLEFAFHMHKGRRHEAERVLNTVRQARRSSPVRAPKMPAEGFVPLATQIGLALEAEGIPHEVGVGTSTFQVPIGILDPEDPTRFVLAILTDDGLGSGSAFETHVHHRNVLSQRGWKVLRVTAAAWYRRHDELLDEIAELVPGVRGAIDNVVYAAHRAAKQRAVPRAPIAAAGAARQPATRQPATFAAPQPPEGIPEWAHTITDAQFRKALLHLAAHLSLSETELVNLVGGPRRARMFANELDGWRDTLPFRVESQDVGGAKVYRNVGPRH